MQDSSLPFSSFPFKVYFWVFFKRSPGPLTSPLQVCIKCPPWLFPVLSATKSCWFFCSCCPSLILISLLISVSPLLLHLRLSIPHSQIMLFIKSYSLPGNLQWRQERKRGLNVISYYHLASRIKCHLTGCPADSVGRACKAWSRGHEVKPHTGHGADFKKKESEMPRAIWNKVPYAFLIHCNKCPNERSHIAFSLILLSSDLH